MKLTDSDVVELALQLHPLVIVGEVDYGKRGALGHRLVVTVAHPSGEYAVEAFSDSLRKIVCRGRVYVLSDRLDLTDEVETQYLGEPIEKHTDHRMELCYFSSREGLPI